MSNIKKLDFEGEIPFDCANHHQLSHYLAQFNGPSFGLRIGWGLQRLVPVPQTKGQNTLYQFRITGEEAVSDAWIEGLLQALVNAGAIFKAKHIIVVDVENNEKYKLAIPSPDPNEVKDYDRHFWPKTVYRISYSIGLVQNQVIEAPDMPQLRKLIKDMATGLKGHDLVWGNLERVETLNLGKLKE